MSGATDPGRSQFTVGLPAVPCKPYRCPVCARLAAAEAELQAHREALAEASMHVHGCKELLTPKTRRLISEALALLAAGAVDE
jgi:hypothetical protein